MMLRVGVLLILSVGLGGLALRGVSAQSRAHRQHILIDGSDSMTGFFEHAGNQIQRLHTTLRDDQADQRVAAFYFVDENLPALASFSAPRGATTKLRNALEKTLSANPKPAIVWLVTDNQPSVGKQKTDSDRDLDQFYALLQSEQVKRIYLFPLRLPFTGKLFTKNDGILRPAYHGLRGLLIYALLLDHHAQAEFDRAASALRERLVNNFQRENVSDFLIKPLQQDTIKAELVSGKNLQVVGERIMGRNFSVGQPIQGDFLIRLTSELGQLNIKEARIEAKASGFQTADFNQAAPHCAIRPDEIKNFSSGAQNRKEFRVSLALDAVTPRDDWASFWRSIVTNSGVIKGEIQVAIEVGRQQIEVSQSSLDSFSTDRDIYERADEETQKKIYKLNDLLRRLIPAELNQITPRVGVNREGKIPVLLRVRLSPWATWAVALLALAALVLPLAVVLWAKRQPLYRLTWEYDGILWRACEDFRLWPLLGRAITLDQRRAATLKKTFAGLKVQANRDYEVDGSANRLLNPHGSDFALTRRSDGATVSFTFAKAHQVGRASAKVDELWGADDYATHSGGATSNGFGGGLGEGLASVPKVRAPVSRAEAPGSARPAQASARKEINVDDFF